MEKKNGNGQQWGDLIVGLHAGVVELQEALDRQHREMQGKFDQMQSAFDGLRASSMQHQQEGDQYIGRIARMLMAVGDKLGGHEHRLAAVESKLS